MSYIWKIILVLSLLFNILALWGLFHYVMYGGSPLSQLKRRLTGTVKVAEPVNPFAEDNQRIMQEIASGKNDSLRVVFYGASITQGWDLDKYFPEIHPVNRGVGTFVPELLIKFKENVLDLKPRAAVIKFCSINIQPRQPLSQLKDAMVMMVEMLEANEIQPIVSTIIPAGKPAAHIGDYNKKDSLAAFNDWVRQYASEKNLPLIDYEKAIADEEGFLPRSCSVDPVHLNEKGYDIIAEAARPVVYQAVGVN